MQEILLFFIALVIHECGHIASAAVLGISILSFNIRSVGAVITFDFSHSGYVKEAIVHLSGALIGESLVAALFLIIGERAQYFFGVSTVLSMVNLLPIDGFDGGGAARCLLSIIFLPDTVWRVCRVLSFIGIILLWTAILWVEMRVGGNPGLMIFIIGIMLGQMK